MVKKIIFLILSGFFLAGCFAESMTLVQSGVGACQGMILHATFTAAVSFGVKKTTGKFPIEHIIAKEKKRIAKKTSELEDKIIGSAKKKIFMMCIMNSCKRLLYVRYIRYHFKKHS